MKYTEPRYDGGMIRTVSTEVVKDLDTVIRLLSVCDSYKDEEKEFAGMNLTFVSDNKMDLGLYPRASIPLNHGTGYAMHVVRTFPVSPGMHLDNKAAIRDYPRAHLHKNADGMVSVGDIRSYLVNAGDRNLRLCDLGYLSETQDETSMKISVSDLVGSFSDADVVFAYARDDAFLNAFMRNAGMRPAYGNVGKDNLENRAFLWYKLP